MGSKSNTIFFNDKPANVTSLLAQAATAINSVTTPRPLDDDETQIVTLLLENYVPADHLEYLFNETGLLERAYVHKMGDAWPRLGDMIVLEKTLVIFWDEGDTAEYPWLHHAWSVRSTR